MYGDGESVENICFGSLHNNSEIIQSVYGISILFCPLLNVSFDVMIMGM